MFVVTVRVVSSLVQPMAPSTRRKSQRKIYGCNNGVVKRREKGDDYPKYGGQPFVLTSSTEPPLWHSSDEKQVYFDETEGNLTGLDRLCEACDLVSQGLVDVAPRKGRKTLPKVEDQWEGTLGLILPEQRSWIGPFHIVGAKKIIDVYSLPSVVEVHQSSGMMHRSGSGDAHQETNPKEIVPKRPFGLVRPRRCLNRMTVPSPVVA